MDRNYIKEYCEQTGRSYPKDGYEHLQVLAEMVSTITITIEADTYECVNQEFYD